MASLLRSLPFSWALGLSLFSGRRRSRISAAAVVSVLGIGVGVATLTAVLAVTGGFEEAFRDRILGVYPHLVILERGESLGDYERLSERIARLPGVVGTNPSTYDEMMIASDGGTAGAIVKGVDLDAVDRVSRLSSLTRKGSLDGLRPREGAPARVLLGCQLLEKLQVQPGDRVSLTTPIRGLGTGGSGPLGMAPQQESFLVDDCVESGFYEYDSRLVVMDLSVAQRFLNRGPAVRWIEVRLADLFATEAARREVLGVLEPHGLPEVVDDVADVESSIRELLPGLFPPEGPRDLLDWIAAVGQVRRALEFSDVGSGPPHRYRIIDWKEMNRNLFAALRTQKVVLALFFLIIVVVAAFNIVGTQLIVARERVKEVSTLVALGASRGQLMRIFIVHGFTLGCAGVLFGLGLGRLVVAGIERLDFNLDPKVYLITRLPAVLHWGDALVIAGASALVVLLSCVLSSWRATRLNPVDGLRKIT